MRLHLTLALITIITLVVTLRAARRHHFTFTEVDQMAQKLVAAKYVAPPNALPPQLQKLTPEQDEGIYWKDTYRLWRKKGLPFQIDFYHLLNSGPQPHIALDINTVDLKGSHYLAYSPTFFNFLNLTTKPPTPMVFNPPLSNKIGYAGFYIRYPDIGIGSNPSSLDGFFSVLGSDYFRVIAKDQVYGLSSRGVALNTTVPGKTEEFPLFTEWWLQEPAPNATELVLDALLEGPSVSGAYEFKIRPGGVTSVDVHASLYFRQAVDRVGIAPFSSMYLYGENAKDHFNDSVHPEIHDSDGALIQNNKDEWLWQPLSQSDDRGTGAKGYQLQTYSFPEENPKGFGLLQRDRDFSHYQDLAMKYNVRPSAWVMPHGDWGKGEVTLIELPSNDFNTDNVILFWHPAQEIKAGDHLDLSYTIDFYMNDAQRPPLAYCKQTLVNCPAPPPPPPPPAPTAPAPPLPANVPPVKPGTQETAKAPNTPPATAKVTTNAPASSGPMGPPAPVKRTGPPMPIGTVPVQFLVDFAGNGIENIPANQPPDLDLTYDPPGTYLREKSVEKNSYDNSWRVTFTIIPLKHLTPTLLRCRLLHDNKPLTETWSYTWRQ
jgi:periplasmic glucans biosynthesis protein